MTYMKGYGINRLKFLYENFSTWKNTSKRNQGGAIQFIASFFTLMTTVLALYILDASQ